MILNNGIDSANVSAPMLRDKFRIERVSLSHFGHKSYSGARSSLDTHIFAEDVHTHAVPYRIRGDERIERGVILSDDTRKNRNLVALIFSEGDVARCYDLDESVYAFIRSAAQRIALRGTVYYEIATLRMQSAADEEDAADSPGIAIKTPLCIPGRVFVFANRVIQLVPSTPERGPRKSFISIPLSHTLRIDLPETICSRRILKATNRTLAAGSIVFPSFVLQDGLMSVAGFDPTIYGQEKDAIRHRALVNWGSPARMLWSTKATEYFAVYRELRFERSMAILREHILSSMNVLLKHIGLPLDIRLTNVPTAADIQTCLDKLAAGQISFDEARKATY